MAMKKDKKSIKRTLRDPMRPWNRTNRLEASERSHFLHYLLLHLHKMRTPMKRSDWYRRLSRTYQIRLPGYPLKIVILRLGIRKETFLRLFSLAPMITI